MGHATIARTLQTALLLLLGIDSWLCARASGATRPSLWQRQSHTPMLYQPQTRPWAGQPHRPKEYRPNPLSQRASQRRPRRPHIVLLLLLLLLLLLPAQLTHLCVGHCYVYHDCPSR